MLKMAILKERLNEVCILYIIYMYMYIYIYMHILYIYINAPPLVIYSLFEIRWWHLFNLIWNGTREEFEVLKEN